MGVVTHPTLTEVPGPSGSLSGDAGYSRPAGHPRIPGASLAVLREGHRAPRAVGGPSFRVSSPQCSQQPVPGPPAQLCPAWSQALGGALLPSVEREAIGCLPGEGPARPSHRHLCPGHLSRLLPSRHVLSGHLRIAPAFHSGPRGRSVGFLRQTCSLAVEGDEGHLPGKSLGCQP